MAKHTEGEKKEFRKQLLITEQLKDMITDTSKSTGMSENELIGLAIFDVLSDSKKFLECPKCRAKLEYKARVSVSCIGEYTCCKCGTVVWWDTEEDKIIKTSTIK